MLLTISVHTQAPYMNTGIYQCTHRYPTCTYKPHTPTCTLKHMLGGFSPWFPNLPLGLRPYVLFRFFCIECFLLLFLEKNTQNLLDLLIASFSASASTWTHGCMPSHPLSCCFEASPPLGSLPLLISMVMVCLGLHPVRV